jgi:hypothetical protein
MSYALAWEPEARNAWRGLDVQIQEQILDRLDTIAESDARDVRPSGVLDFETKPPAPNAIVFLVLRVSHARHEVAVTRLGSVPIT